MVSAEAFSSHPPMTRSEHNARRHPLSLVAAASLTLAVAQAGLGQIQVQPDRITPSRSTTGPSRPAGPNAPGTAAGRGAAMGDGNRLGGQTFSWSRTSGSGRALGSGNILDANTQVGSGRSNTTTAPVDYNARNLLVTGNVAGGRGFRGSVGYTADTDFRGSTGSDDTFKFSADSAYSSVAFSSSTLSRDRFMMAQGLGAYEFRRESTPDGAVSQRIGTDRPESRLRLDRATSAMALGRLNWDVGEDRTVATGTSAEGDAVRYIVSPLRGLQTERLTDPLMRAGLGLYEQARARQEVALGLAKPEDFLPRARAIERGMVDAQVKPTDAGEQNIEQSRVFAPGYLDILKSVDSAAAEKTGEQGATLDRVKRDLGERTKPKTPEKPVPGATKPDAGKPTDRDTDRGARKEPPTEPAPGMEPIPADREVDREKEREKIRGRLLTVQEMAEILRHGKTITSLGREDQRRVAELMRLGEASIKSGDYFTAERRFMQAQDYRTGDPLIEVGLAHAQLGGGLYLSSALTLRNLFKSNPELIDTRYERTLLPTGERLDSAVRFIRERIALGEDRPNYGFLLAYIGHQVGERTLIEEGLKQVGGTESLDVYGELLRGVWLAAK